MFDHHQRIAGVAQFLHDRDHTAHVTRMQADRWFVQDEQRVGQRRAECGGQVDALDFASRERARLTVERQVTEADFLQVGQPRTGLTQQQFGGFIQRDRRQMDGCKKLRTTIYWQAHQVVNGQARHIVQLCLIPCDIFCAITHARLDHGIRILLVAHAP